MTRFKHDDNQERDLPERDRLTPPPDFPPVVRTHLDPVYDADLYRTPYLDGPTRWFHSVDTRLPHIACEAHRPGTADRFGHAECKGCGAELWSKWWVAEGIFGLASTLDPDALDGTGEWLAKEVTDWEHRALSATDPGRTTRVTDVGFGTFEV